MIFNDFRPIPTPCGLDPCGVAVAVAVAAVAVAVAVVIVACAVAVAVATAGCFWSCWCCSAVLAAAAAPGFH